MNMKPTNQILEFTFFYAKLIVGDISLLTWRHVRHEQSKRRSCWCPYHFCEKKTLHMWLLSCVAINWVTCLAAGHVSENALFTLPGQEFKQYWLNIEISINIKWCISLWVATKWMCITRSNRRAKKNHLINK